MVDCVDFITMFNSKTSFEMSCLVCAGVHSIHHLIIHLWLHYHALETFEKEELAVLRYCSFAIPICNSQTEILKKGQHPLIPLYTF